MVHIVPTVGQNAQQPKVEKSNLARLFASLADPAECARGEQQFARHTAAVASLRRGEFEERLQYLMQLDDGMPFYAAVSNDLLQITSELCRLRHMRKAVVPPLRRASTENCDFLPHVSALVRVCGAAKDEAIDILRGWCAEAKLMGKSDVGFSLVSSELAELLLERGKSNSDVTEALVLLDDAVGAQHPGAMLRVGLCLRDGVGVAPDLRAALVWMERAADVGYSPAMFELGAMYEDGAVCPASGVVLCADWAEAAWWYTRAAQRGHTMAQLNIGKLLLTAVTAAHDTPLAGRDCDAIAGLRARSRSWLETAASAGSEEAVRLLRCL